jgi:hypothetical protein
MTSDPATEPTEPGWYVTRDRVNDWMLYARDTLGNWSAHVLNGDSTDCPWSYIDQAGPVRLVLPYPRPESETHA